MVTVRFGLMTGRLRFGYGYGLNPKSKPVYHPYTIICIDSCNVSDFATAGINDSAISCCDQLSLHPECFQILIDADDPFYSDKGVTCLDFVRSAPAPQGEIGM